MRRPDYFYTGWDRDDDSVLAALRHYGQRVYHSASEPVVLSESVQTPEVHQFQVDYGGVIRVVNVGGWFR